MSRLFYHVMQDNVGNLLFDVSGTMRLAGSGTLATIYGDEALTVILPNPMTNHPSFGSFKCFLGAGDYDFYMAKAGYTFETLTGVQGHGTMAQQDAANVAITGGSAAFSGALTAAGQVGLGGGTVTNEQVTLSYNKSLRHALTLRPSGGDGDAGAALQFLNVAAALVGTITTTGSATAYNTTSDSRLKTAVEELTGELALIRALRPVRFRWLVDDSPGVGFLASEVAEHVQGVVTGEPNAVDEEGRILPQQIDMSKLVPFLVGACQTLARRLAVLEDALGV